MTGVEASSGSALETLKGTVRYLQEQSVKDREEAQKTLDRTNEQSRSARDRLQQRIELRDNEVDRLRKENEKIGVLEREKGWLEQEVSTLKNDSSNLKQRAVDDRIMATVEENQALQSRNAVLSMAVETEKARFQELQNKYDALERRELKLIERDEWSRAHFEESKTTTTAQVGQLNTRVAELEAQVKELQGELSENVKAIDTAKNLESQMDQLKLNASRHKIEFKELEEVCREGKVLLSQAEEECYGLREQLDESAAAVTSLEGEKEALGRRVDEKMRETLQEREKARLLKEELERAAASQKSKSERIASLEGGAEAQGKEIARLVDQVAKLGDEVAKAQSLLGTERGKVESLVQIEAELRASLESLERDKKGLEGSLDEIRRWQLGAVQQHAELTEKNRALVVSVNSTRELERQVSKLTGDVARKEQEVSRTDQELSMVREKLAWWDKSHNTALSDATSRIDSMETQISDLTQRLSQTSELLTKAERQAQEGVEELQGFLARLCLTSPEDSSVFTGLAQQVQVRCDVTSPGPAQVSGWSILATWGEREVEVEDVAPLPSGFETMVLELYKAAVTGQISSRRCHLTMKGMMELVSTSPVVHTGVFSELATVFVKAVEAQPVDGFEAGIVFWQLLSTVEQRWRPDLAAAKDGLTAILGAHEYRDVFAIVMGHKNPEEGEECHFFTDTRAVFTRDASSAAAVIDTKDRSIRFFAKSRWTASIWGYDIKSPDSKEAIHLESRVVKDIQWSWRI